MSAAADDPDAAAARVSVVATLGYCAFLAGPPLLGQLADRVGTLNALLALAVLMVPAALTVFAARPSKSGPADSPRRTGRDPARSMTKSSWTVRLSTLGRATASTSSARATTVST